MPRRQATSAFVCLLAIAALAVGCGGGSGSSISTAGTAASKPAPPKSDFPKTEGKTLGEIVKAEIGRASCRERGVDLGGRRIIKKKKKRKRNKRPTHIRRR